MEMMMKMIFHNLTKDGKFGKTWVYWLEARKKFQKDNEDETSRPDVSILDLSLSLPHPITSLWICVKVNFLVKLKTKEA